MREGDIVIITFTQADGAIKQRPALVLKEMPPFRDLLVCGISTQLHQYVPDFDELISPKPSNGLKRDSVIRLGFLTVEPRTNIGGKIGIIPSPLHQTLLKRLADYLLK